jgi:hypothetical protein
VCGGSARGSKDEIPYAVRRLVRTYLPREPGDRGRDIRSNADDSEELLIDLGRDADACRKYGVSLARWQASLIHPDLNPRRPVSVRREIGMDRLGFRRYVVLAPYSSRPAENWPSIHWIRLIYLLRRFGLELLVTGPTDEEMRLAEICDESGAFWVTNESPDWLSDVLLGAAGSSPVPTASHISQVCSMCERSHCIHISSRDSSGTAPA